MLKKACRIFLFLAGTALFLNAVFLMIYASMNIGTYITLFFGAIFLFSSIFWKKIIELLKNSVFKIIIAFSATVVVSIALIVSFLFLYGAADNVDYKEDYVIVLGCGLQGETPTAPLIRRLDTALKYAEQNKDCKIIVSGGQGNGESIPEAEAMYRYLTERNIDAERIIRECESTSTTENFKYSAKLVDDIADSSTAFITNDFHIYRAEQLAKLLGYNFTHIHADTDYYNVIPVSLREILAIMKMYVLKN